MKKRDNLMIKKQPFPVVGMWIRVNHGGGICTHCGKPAEYFGEDWIGDTAGLSVEDHWERTYQEQHSGRTYPKGRVLFCEHHARWAMALWLGKPIEFFLVYTLGMQLRPSFSVVLYDRNISRDSTYPSLACGEMKDIWDFREQLWNGPTYHVDITGVE